MGDNFILDFIMKILSWKSQDALLRRSICMNFFIIKRNIHWETDSFNQNALRTYRYTMAAMHG